MRFIATCWRCCGLAENRTIYFSMQTWMVLYVEAAQSLNGN